MEIVFDWNRFKEYYFGGAVGIKKYRSVKDGVRGFY
jgi:hypothetical protein